MSKSVLPRFTSKSFVVSGFSFNSLTPFELIFVLGVRKYYDFIFSYIAVQERINLQNT